VLIEIVFISPSFLDYLTTGGGETFLVISSNKPAFGLGAPIIGAINFTFFFYVFFTFTLY
jgi:hypothetical protein